MYVSPSLTQTYIINIAKDHSARPVTDGKNEKKGQ